MDRAQQGAHGLDACLSILPTHVKRLLTTPAKQNLIDALDELKSTLHMDIILSSSYSGSGAFEYAATQVLQTCAQVTEPQGESTSRQWICHSASEVGVTERAWLLGLKGMARHEHVFGDILDRLPRPVYTALKTMEEDALSALASLKDQLQQGIITNGEFSAGASAMGQQYVDKICKELAGIEFESDVWCYRHQSLCPVSPRSASTHSSLSRKTRESALWIEVAGNTCVPWSPMAKRDGGTALLDRSTLVFLCWAFSAKFYEPDLIIQENVARFDHELLEKIWSQPSQDPLEGVVDVGDSVTQLTR